MARLLYGLGPDDRTATSSGATVPNAEVTVWDALTGGAQVTDITAAGVGSVSGGVVTTDAYGRVGFYGPDGTVGPLFLEGSGGGPRVRVSPSPVDVAQAADLSGNASLNATLAGVQKFDRGGMVLKPVRTPTLVVGRHWPNQNHDYRILWASEDGETLYACGSDRTLRKSTNGGVTWTKRGYHANGFGGSSVFVKTTAGTLLTFKDAFPLSNIVMRSTDDGATWTEVHSETTRTTDGLAPMHVTSMKQDPTTGYIYWGEYQNSNTAPDVKIYRSTDDGATWSTFHTFPGPASSDPNKIRHVHSIEYDDVMGRIVFMIGDDDPKAGIYRVNAAGTGVEPLVLNDQITNIFNGDFMATRCARAISYIPFPDCIVYGGDTASNPWIMRIPRSELGKANPQAERLYELNSTVWFACKASADGTRWVMSASQEAPTTRLDSAVHLYCIEDQGDTITEIASFSVNSTNSIAVAPVGSSVHGGDTFYLQAYETANRYSAWRCEIARGGGAALLWGGERPAVAGWQTFSSGRVTLAAGAEVVFGVTTVPRGDLNWFRLFEAGLRSFPTNNALLKLTIRTAGGSVVWENSVTTPSLRHWFDESDATYLMESGMTAGSEIHFVLRNTSGLSLDAVAHATFGWGGVRYP